MKAESPNRFDGGSLFSFLPHLLFLTMGSDSAPDRLTKKRLPSSSLCISMMKPRLSHFPTIYHISLSVNSQL